MRWIESLDAVGLPCESLVIGNNVAKVWQASRITAGGVWCYSINEGTVETVKGNKGIAKSTAKRKLLLIIGD